MINIFITAYILSCFKEVAPFFLSRTQVSIAFLHAAARFNAFEVWASAADIAEFKSEKNTEQKYFEAIYKKRLDEELNEFETNFDKYRKELAI
jgi:hypothetical protein